MHPFPAPAPGSKFLSEKFLSDIVTAGQCPSYRHYESFSLGELPLIGIEGQELRCPEL